MIAVVRRWSFAAALRPMQGVSKSKLVCRPFSKPGVVDAETDRVEEEETVLIASRAVTAGIVSTTRARNAARSIGPRLVSGG